MRQCTLLIASQCEKVSNYLIYHINGLHTAPLAPSGYQPGRVTVMVKGRLAVTDASRVLVAVKVAA